MAAEGRTSYHPDELLDLLPGHDGHGFSGGSTGMGAFEDFLLIKTVD